MNSWMPGDRGSQSQVHADRPEGRRTAPRAYPPLLADEQWASLAIRHQLRKREVDVLKWLTRGASLPQIGRKLGLSYETVRGYARAAYRKLACRGRVELILRLVHTNWIPPDVPEAHERRAGR